MPTIFVDEAGYTGRNLLDPDQPIFSLASVNLQERECQEIKHRYFGFINANELKYSSVKKSPKQRESLLKFLTISQKIRIPLNLLLFIKNLRF